MLLPLLTPLSHCCDNHISINYHNLWLRYRFSELMDTVPANDLDTSTPFKDQTVCHSRYFAIHKKNTVNYQFSYYDIYACHLFCLALSTQIIKHTNKWKQIYFWINFGDSNQYQLVIPYIVHTSKQNMLTHTLIILLVLLKLDLFRISEVAECF